MKTSIGVLSLVSVVFAAIISAQTQPLVLKGHIPFEFTCGEESLPAGDYSINVLRSPDRIQFVEANGRRHAIAIAIPRQDRDANERAQLLFHQYGSQQFLSAIYTSSANLTLRASRTERELARQSKPTDAVVAVR